ncbi:ShKT domain-containing protein [Madurella fahalii]|uniref:ShKT domain-containing protein n=1 Tax=Madurella fahalii TaxID=1157608 RepID=A0ABQ0G2I7_9PEZI
MCEYTQREYSCGHFRQYKSNETRCSRLPDITAFKDRDMICGECRAQQNPLQWALVFRRRLSAARWR